MGMIEFRKFALFAALPVLFVGSYAAARTHRHAHSNQASHKPGQIKMAIASLQTCEVQSAKINLVDEGLLTWTAITAETIDTVAKPFTLAKGDPRLAKLNEILHTLTIKEAVLPQLEMRMMMRLTCADGKTHVIAGSKTDSNGHMHLNIDGRMAMTDTALRKALDALVH
jgi:hypothetical protein